MFIDRHQFFQYIFKQILKQSGVPQVLENSGQEDFLGSSNDVYDSLSVFKDFLEKKLDMFTIAWLNLNIDILKDLFSKLSLTS